MKEKIKEFYLEKSKRTYGYNQLIAVCENGDEYIVGGDYCGGVPVSSWHKINSNPN